MKSFRLRSGSDWLSLIYCVCAFLLAVSCDEASCIVDPTQSQCTEFTYPDSKALSAVRDMCRQMKDMVACSIVSDCFPNSDSTAPQIASPFCRPLSLLGDLCLDHGRMKQCSDYNALCRTGSRVKQCSLESPVPGLPSTMQIRTAIKAMCQSHTMEECAQCPAGVGGNSWSGCNVLGMYTSMCKSMPDMAECSHFKTMCQVRGARSFHDDFGTRYCAVDESTSSPVMRMYFHDDMVVYILFKEWVPRSRTEYAGWVIAVFLFAVLFELLHTVRAVLETWWASMRPGPGPAAVSLSLNEGREDRGSDREPLLKSPDAYYVTSTTMSMPSGEGCCPAQSCCSKVNKRVHELPEAQALTMTSRSANCGCAVGEMSAAACRQKPWYLGLASHVFMIHARHPFDWRVELIRAGLHAVETLLSYALMLLAMTFNIGLFLAIVAGFAVGAFAFGRFQSYTRKLCC